MTTALLCTAMLGILLFVLGFAVSLTRGRSEKVIGYDASPTDPLHKVVRAHGNTAEYAPMLALLMLALGALQPSAWMLAAMWTAVAARYLIVVGLLVGSLDAANPMRFIGALMTYVSGFALCVAVLLSI